MPNRVWNAIAPLFQPIWTCGVRGLLLAWPLALHDHFLKDLGVECQVEW